MTYLTRAHMHFVCCEMDKFYQQLSTTYSKFGMSLEQNRGRRNVLMSGPMEYFLGNVLKKSFKEVTSDGRTGKADLVIKLNSGVFQELECKLTSPHESSETITLQTDYDTLNKKSSLDYVYLIADKDFTGFCAIHFLGLTVLEFRKLSNGARGKVQMKKYLGMKKGRVLLGEAIDLNQISINKIKDSLTIHVSKMNDKIESWEKDLKDLRPTQLYQKKQIREKINRHKIKLAQKINKTNNQIKIKEKQNSRYTFKFEKVA